MCIFGNSTTEKMAHNVSGDITGYNHTNGDFIIKYTRLSRTKTEFTRNFQIEFGYSISAISIQVVN